MSELNQNYNITEETLENEPQFVSEASLSALFSFEQAGKLKEKRQIKKIGNTVGISLILLLAVSIVLGVFLGISGLIFGSSQNVLEFLEDPAVATVTQIVFSLFGFTVPFIVCYKIAGYRIGDLVSFEKSEKSKAIPLFFLGIGFCAFANIGSSVLGNIFSSIGFEYNMPETPKPQGIFGFLLSVIATAIVPAIVEEFALRGIVLGSLRKFGDSFALITSAVCFGVMHGNFVQIPFACMVGLFLGFTVIKTNSLRTAIAIHFINNFVAVLMDYLPKSVTTDAQNVIYMVYLCLALVCGIVALRFVSDEFLKLEKADTELSRKEKYKAFFLSGGIIVFIIINLLEAVSFMFI